MTENKQVKIIPAKIRDPQAPDSEIYISETNQSTGLKITHYQPIGGQQFSPTNPLSPNAQIQYLLSCSPNAVLSTTNSYLGYTMQFSVQCPTANAQDGTGKGPYGKYFMRNGYWWFQNCTNIAAINNVNAAQPTFAQPVAICLAPMNSTNILYRTVLNYGGESFEDLYVFRERTFLQSLLSEEYQASMPNTWFDQNLSNIIEFEIMPFTYGNVGGITAKQYNTPANFLAGINGAAAQYAVDGFTRNGNLVTYTFQKQFIIPLNLINQIFDVGNLFYISLLKNQQLTMNLYLNPYTTPQMFGTSDLFGNSAAGNLQTGIINLDLVLVTKESEVATTDESSKDNIVKFYPKYQYQLFPTQLASNVQSCQITTMHNSVQDVMLQLNLPDENCSQYGQAPYQFNDSTYIKQRCTLYNASQLIAIQNGYLPIYVAGEPIMANVVAGANANFIDQNMDFYFFYKINFDRGNDSERLYSRWFSQIDQMRQELMRSLNYLSQYVDTPPKAYYNLSDLMTKYAYFLANFESFSMDIAGAHTFVGGDGYYSKDGMILCNFQIGRFRLSQNNGDTGGSINDFNAAGTSLKSFIQNSVYRVACYQFYDECLKMCPKSNGNQLSQDEEPTK